VDQPPPGELPGTVIGPYKLLEQIGEGGMGTVWMAEQTQPIHRRVAVKVIKAGMDSKQVLARFEAERQALALMDHPNIARVLDAGETPPAYAGGSPRPYFVMELVKGTPITKYCDDKHLSVRERLELFGDVCRAVQHAHQKGIIHRDLKPSNILIAPFDGKPVVKVIDFGVAKATGQRLTDATLFTGFGAVVGTPEYMSPEQAETNNQDIDTRSDIYSLGVLLYELLTGSTPLTKKRVKEAALLEVLRVIREEDPPKPSTRLSTTDELPSVAANRGLEPKKLSGVVRGELDWIVMKALEKDRNRRYETANGFAMDVQRYLADEPVAAGPPSAWYRFRKFARRNRTGLAVAGLILFFIAVLGGGGGWVIRDRAAREEAAAKERRDREQRLTAQIELILEEVERLEREQKWPEALAAVKRAEATLAGGDAGDAVRQRVGDALRDLAFVARLEQIRQDHAATVEGDSNSRGAVRDFARAFREYGVDVEALPADQVSARLQAKPALAVPLALALDDWAIARSDLGAEPSWKPLVAVARALDHDPLRDRLRAFWIAPKTPESQSELRKLAESIDVKTHGPATLGWLAQTLYHRQLKDSAIAVLRAGQLAYPGDYWLNSQLGLRLEERGDYIGAIQCDSACIALHPNSIAAHNNLGNVLRAIKHLDEAIREFRTLLQIDPNDAIGHNNLGNALNDKKDLAGALREYRSAIKLDPSIAAFHHSLANALYDSNDLEEAIREYRIALKINPNDVKVRSNLGLALHDMGDVDGAIREYHSALRIDPNNAPSHLNLGIALLAKKDVEGAIRECHAALKINPNYAKGHMGLGNALFAKNDLDGAIREFRAAAKLDPNLAAFRYNLANALRDSNDLDEAILEYRAALKIEPNFASAHNNLGLALRDTNDLEGAIAEFREALRITKDSALVSLVTNNLRDAEQLAESSKRLLAVREGRGQIRDDAERIAFARLCQLCRKEYAAAVRFYAEAFAADAKLADDLGSGHRYNAACAAALAGCGRGKDADKLDDKERARLRRHALDWLRADLVAWGRLLKKEPDKTGPVLVKTMQHWQQDTDFAGVRGTDVIAKLPEAERQEWQKLWNDVADLLKRAQAKK
jgi:tetratricopeptide (TPR) repeat protein/serine/threonine protein kinase